MYSIKINIMLTDKARIDFNKWLNQQEVAPYAVMFDELPLNVRCMYIIEFFDSVNIYLNPTQRMPKEVNKWAFIVDFELYDKLLFKTRQEANEEAVKKANQIYNTQSKA